MNEHKMQPQKNNKKDLTLADGMMHRNLALRACEIHTPFIKILTTVLKVPKGDREGVETPGLPEGYLSTLCVRTRFCDNNCDLEQGDVISKPSS